MSGKCFCHFNGYEVKDAAARQKCIELDGRVESLERNGGGGGGSGPVTPTLCSDANNATTAGFYFMVLPASNLPDGFSGDSTLLVEWHQNGLQQTIKQNNMIAVRCYNLWTGTWNPWEYLNPPMVNGVEYRTTEMHNGSPVYVKRIIRNIAIEKGDSIALGVDISQMVDFYGTLTGGDGEVYSLSSHSGLLGWYFSKRYAALEIPSSSTFPVGYPDAIFTFKYTK